MADDESKLNKEEADELLRIALTKEGSWFIRATKQPGFVAIVLTLLFAVLLITVLLATLAPDALPQFLSDVMKFQILEGE